MAGNNKEQKIELIDLDQAFKDKNPGLYKLLPKFILNRIKKIVHQDGLNKIILDNEFNFGVDFLDNALDVQFGVKIKVKGEENLPVQGRYIFVSNHPLGGMDGMAIIRYLGKRYGKVKAVINDLLMRVVNLRPVFVGVNLYGKNSREGIKALEDDLNSDAQIFFFPAGLCSRKINGKVQDGEWKKTFISKAIKHKMDVVPVYCDASNSKFFYNLGHIRKKLGIKLNIEMLYLPDEMYKQSGKTITFTFGKPIPFQTFDTSRPQNEWAAQVRKYVYEMAEGKMADFKP